ncbi:family 16 glycoside hydrolase [Pontibacter sp. G13]|uniref:family 16 glycoside hydrolase n=1 Tax=Pontibacter sp. G13 TaxID=3074898 RepID=UPI00288C305B|nr:family 16 glycoside hydrolase [Pontibacter sp. G13]WNJ19637.1 family 16 glycoside hydrolase [Pontibacter sp. G13]
MKHWLLVGLLAVAHVSVSGQTTTQLKSMEGFQPQAGNWQIVGAVTMNPTVDVHEQPSTPPATMEATTGKKKRKKRGAIPPPPPPKPQAVSFEQGTGILLNMNNDSLNDALVTSWEHGDVSVSFDVMIPKGSNSGVYFQGRYEVQLFDSYGVRQPGFSDIGGIYRNWESTPARQWIGKAPTVNVAKAPGTWQQMTIQFRAPRFDEAGNKIQHARFDMVKLNGQIIHAQVEVPHPTGGAISPQEVEMGPLLFQGDHGPVAIRNLKVRHMAPMDLEIGEWQYEVYEGEFRALDQVKAATATATGTTPALNCRVMEAENKYGLHFTTQVEIVEAGEYTFRIGYAGGIQMLVDGEEYAKEDKGAARGERKFTLNLTAGKHELEIWNYKFAPWRAPRLGLFIRKPGTDDATYHDADSYPVSRDLPKPIYVEAESRASTLRGFVDVKNAEGGNTRLSHSIGVSNPEGVHYVFDLQRGLLAGAWRGDFANATPMWNSRGNGSFKPRGAIEYTFLQQPIAKLSDSLQAFPSEVDGLLSKGYTIDRESGRPSFQYAVNGTMFQSDIQPSEDGHALVHEIKAIEEASNAEGYYYKLAEGSAISLNPSGAYAIDGQRYFLQMKSAHVPFIRSTDRGMELVVRMDQSPVAYEMMW